MSISSYTKFSQEPGQWVSLKLPHPTSANHSAQGHPRDWERQAGTLDHHHHTQVQRSCFLQCGLSQHVGHRKDTARHHRQRGRLGCTYAGACVCMQWLPLWGQ